MSRLRPAVFLDRDGTLIEGEGYLGDPAAVRPLPGAAEAVALLGDKGWARVVVTNQSGVARGYFSADDYRAVERRVLELIPGIDATYVCFHLPDGAVEPFARACDCRKPKPGMLLDAAGALALDLSASVLAGDDLRDLAAARACGVRPVLVRTGKGARNEQRLAAEGFADVDVFADLLALARSLPEVTR